MAKKVDKSVALTMTLPGIPARRGRPPKADALSNSERQAKFRKTRRLVETGEKIGATIKRFSRDFDVSEAYITRELLRFALCNKNWQQTGFPLRVTKIDEAS